VASSLDVTQNTDKVTFLAYRFPQMIVFGSKEGRLTFYNLQKKDTFSFVLDQKIGK